MGFSVRPFAGKEDWELFTKYNPIRQVEDTDGVVMYKPDTGEVIAMLICDTWYAHSVNIHLLVLDRTIDKTAMLIEAMAFVFENPDHPDIRIAYGFIPENNVMATELARRFGFDHVYTLSGGEGGIGFNIFTFTEQQFIELKRA